jgi:hypothetical protein
MRLRTPLPFVFACAVFSLIVVLPFTPDPHATGFYRFEITIRAEQAGIAQLYWDDGHGYAESNSAQQAVPDGLDARVSFPLPVGRLVGLRLDPLDRAGRVTLRDARILTGTGENLRRFAPHTFAASHQIATLQATGDTLIVATTSGAEDPSLAIGSFEPLVLPHRSSIRTNVFRALLVFAGLLGSSGAVVVAGILRPTAVHPRQLLGWFAARPVVAITTTSVLAALASSYSVSATSLQHSGFPWSSAVSVALAKSLLASGVGLVVWQLARHLPAALLMSGSAPFNGLFPAAMESPAVLATGFAPWVLCGWLSASRAETAARSIVWFVLWLVANLALLLAASPTALVLAIGMNTAGFLAVSFEARAVWRAQLPRLLALTVTAGGFALLIGLDSSHRITAAAASATLVLPQAVFQLPPGLFVGVFDSAFQRAFHGGYAINPSANFFTLFGLGWVAVRARDAWGYRPVRAFALVWFASAAALFGVVSPDTLAPTLGLPWMSTFDESMASLLTMLSFVLGGWGWAQAWCRLASRDGSREAAMVAVLVLAGIASYYGTAQAILRTLEVQLAWGIWIRTEPWIAVYALSLLSAGAVFMTLIAVRVRQSRWTSTTLLLALLCLYLLHWRTALQ